MPPVDSREGRDVASELNVVSMRVCCRHHSVYLFTIPLVQLSSHVVSAVSRHLSLTSFHFVCDLHLPCEQPDLLAPSTYVQDKAAYSIHSRHRRGALPIHKLLSRHQCPC
ncbi:hypothetical protein FOQG_19404 [Fusarium oxysporum f. sp. raphani 54005]|uniref:Uncharacterized protein n=1 Tax=Fusarium oxysporum f. sp. raphani 54005 TaxID=1089458 RepID=X0BAI5_FUSOX|nr:hypothetical protein FOQG_19404 [Fusarium oxysporum f. sp. raphani 54005]